MHRIQSTDLENHLSAIVGERNPYYSPDKLLSVGNYIDRFFSTLGLAPVKEEVMMDDVTGFNVHATIQGDPDAATWLVGAHYDSVPESPGADDNASAVAALLEIAHCLKETPPGVHVRLSAFTFEEYGMVGSNVTAERICNSEQEIEGMISLEMVGYTDKRKGAQKFPAGVDPSQYPDIGDFIAVVGNESSLDCARKVTTGMRGATPELGVEMLVVPGNGEILPDVRRSDHLPFWLRNMPAVMITDTANFRNPNYHLPSDTLDTLDIDFLRQVTQSVAGFLINANNNN